MGGARGGLGVPAAPGREGRPRALRALSAACPAGRGLRRAGPGRAGGEGRRPGREPLRPARGFLESSPPVHSRGGRTRLVPWAPPEPCPV